MKLIQRIVSRFMRRAGALAAALLMTLSAPAGDAPAAMAPLVLENAVVRVRIDPAVGRVMEFTPKTSAARNLLWTNDPQQREKEAAQAGYRNWGGDKVWPVAQPFWRFALGRVWPPDTASDGAAADAQRVAARTVRLRFPVSEAFGSQLTREFELSATEAVLVIRNRIEQVRPSPFPAQVWSITQVPLPERVVLDVAADRPFGVTQPVNMNPLRSRPPLGPQAFIDKTVREGAGWVSMRPTREGQQKFGTLGRWIAGVWSDGILVQRVALDAQGMYPEATSLQFYYSGPYGELETLGPARSLLIGEVLTTTVVWQWLDDVDPALDDADLARAVEASRSELLRAGVAVPPVPAGPPPVGFPETNP